MDLNHILIVDDWHVSRRLIKNKLNDLGYGNFTEATDPLGAYVELIQNNSINFVILGEDMSMLCRIKLINDIRNSSEPDIDKHIPILVVVGKFEEENQKKLLEAGASGFIVKLFTPDQLGAKIREILEQIAK